MTTLRSLFIAKNCDVIYELKQKQKAHINFPAMYWSIFVNDNARLDNTVLTSRLTGTHIHNSIC